MSTFRPPLVKNPVYLDLDNDGDPDVLRGVIHGDVPVQWIDDDDDMKKGDTTNWRKSFFFQYFESAGAAPTLQAVRTSKYKLVKYTKHPEWTQLFNLRDDPYETKNLANNPELLQRMEAELARQAKAVQFRVPDIVKNNKPKAAKKKKRKK